MALTRQQLEANIEAMEKQGASQSEIQEYLNKLPPPTTPPPIQPEKPYQPSEDKNIFIQGGKMIGKGLGDLSSLIAKDNTKYGMPTEMVAASIAPFEIAKSAVEFGGEIAGGISKTIPRVLASSQEVATRKPVSWGNVPILGKIEGVSELSGKRASEMSKSGIDPVLSAIAGLGLTGLEYIGDISATGDIAQKGLQKLATRTGEGGIRKMSKELSTAVMPGRMKAEQLTKWNKDVERSGKIISEQLKENKALQSGVQKINNFDDLYNATIQAKSNIWSKVKSLLQSKGKDIAIDGDEIARALDDVMTPEMVRENPNALTRLDELQKAYRGSKLDVQEAEAILESKNAALNSFYSNRGNSMASIS